MRAPLKSSLSSDVEFKAHGIKPVWLLLPILFDTVIFLLTIIKTYSMNKQHRAVSMRSKLASVLMRDGAQFNASN